MGIRDLKVGYELECIDCDAYLAIDNTWMDSRKKILNSSLVVDYIYENGALGIEGIDFCIPVSDFKYFKKKEDKAPHNFGNVMCDKDDVKYTFDDLVKLSSKAIRDKVAQKMIYDECGVLHLFLFNGDQINVGVGFSCDQIKDKVEIIKSLYSETFVIECEDDIKRIKVGAKITLNNGSLLTVKNTYFIVEDHISIDAYTDECTTCQNLNRNIGIVFLKGATVEQKLN